LAFGRINGAELVLSNIVANSLIYKLKIRGLRIHPWRTPFEYGKNSVL
jgi:hypothetical protein